MIVDQVAAFVERARAAGVRVEHRVEPDMVHNWHVLASIFAASQRSIDEIGAFVRSVT